MYPQVERRRFPSFYKCHAFSTEMAGAFTVVEEKPMPPYVRANVPFYPKISLKKPVFLTYNCSFFPSFSLFSHTQPP
jgi:hypothetical protein